MTLRVLSVVGTRPQFVKLCPVHHALLSAGFDHVVVHTGQHHDERLSGAFYRELGLPEPDDHLGVGSASHGAQTGAMLAACESSIARLAPDAVVNYGDTNSTIAGALAAAKLDLPTVHVEAGVRSFDRSMPEEINRLAVDHISTLCLAPTQTAMDNLAAEGLADRSRLVGDVMIDVLLQTASTVGDRDLPAGIDPSRPFVLVTLHRPENTDDPVRLAALVDALAQFDVPVLLPAHPRLTDRAATSCVTLARGSIVVLPPLTYGSLVATALRARAVVTDSGGLQKEMHVLGVPCTTVRATTEWPETLVDGANVLCTDPARLKSLAMRSVTLSPQRPASAASDRVAEAIGELLSGEPPRPR